MIKKIERDYLIDTLRGLMLVMMTLDHTRFFIRRYSFSILGFFGAAMGFIYLSGYVFGLVYSRYTYSSKLLIRRTYKRIFYIYKYHIFSFAIILLISWLTPTLLNSKKELYLKFFSDSKMLIKFITLTEQPPGFDILPLYIFLLLFSPFVLIAFNRGYKKLILFLSFFIWLIFQFDFVKNGYGELMSALHINLGYFNFFSWQFLFVIGLFFGHSKLHDEKVIVFTNNRKWIALVIALVIFLIRQIGEEMQWKGIYELLEFRRFLNPLRLISFFIIAYLIAGCAKYLKISKQNFLTFLGQHSIDVFTFQLLIMSVLKKDGLSKVVQLIIAAIIIISLAIPAIIKEENKLKKKEKRKERIINYIFLIFSFPIDVYNKMKYLNKTFSTKVLESFAKFIKKNTL